jgi:KDO2-lipid IV(A) lauroyltransferase
MKTHESCGRDILRLIVWYPLRWLLLLLPTQAGLFILRRMGDLHYAAGKGKRQVLMKNLRRMRVSDQEHPHIIRAYCRNHYVDQLFPILFPKFNAGSIRACLSVAGLEHLDAALKRKKGVVLVHGHCGPAHLPLVGLALMGYPMKQIGNPSDNGLSWIGRHVAFRLRMAYERKMPAEIIKADTFLRPVFTALRQNQVVMVTGDGSGTKEQFGRQHSFIFLGQPVVLPLGPAVLARKTGAALLPLFIQPGSNPPFAAIIEEEIASSLPGDEGVLECTARFAARLEHYIRLYPGYMNFLDRFSPGQFITQPNS